MLCYKIKVYPSVQKDIKTISEYMKEYNADKIIDKIYKDINNLQIMPRIHKTLIYFKDKEGEYRRMISGKYSIIYKMVQNEVIILRIFNQKQNYLNQRNFILKEKFQRYVVTK